MAQQLLRVFPGKEAMSEPLLTIRLFGPLEVRLRGASLPRLPTRKIAWTLALLVLRRDRAVERDWLAGTLWPESAAEQAYYNLRRSLSELRRALGPEAWRITTPNRHAVLLDLSGADVDLVCFDEAIGRADAASLAQAVAVYGGPLLEGCTEEWVLPEREAREQAYLGALERLAAESLSTGDPAFAVAHLRRAVAVDPLRESAQRLLLEALAAAGEYGEAVQSYRNLRLLLWDEVRTEPSPETRAIYERIRAEAREHAARDASRARREARPSAVPSVASLPPIWNVPHRRNPSFIGREAVLSRIEVTLAAGGPAALTQAVVGLGGIGKTQCAVEYAYRHADDHQITWWVRAEEPAQLAADYAALAASLDLPEKGAPDQRASVAAVRGWLERNGGWLLIFDNAPDPQAVTDYLPRAGGGHVLITSRSQNWGRTAIAVLVPVLPREEAVAFLEQRTGWTGPKVAVLADELGELPLALEQAAAYAEATGCDVSSYLDLFRSRWRELLEPEEPPEGYRETVATTWGLSMAETGARCPAAAQLLNLCAYLAPDEIPLSLIQEGAEFYPEPLTTTAQDLLLLHGAVAALRRYSLVTIDQEALTVHRLVQAVVRDGLSSEEERVWVAAAVRAINKGFPEDPGDVRAWPACARRIPHALAATDLAVYLTAAPSETGRLLGRIGRYLHSRVETEQARAHEWRWVQSIESAVAHEHPELMTRLEDLVWMEHWDAKPALERALAIAERAWGSQAADFARVLSKFGGALWQTDQSEGKEALERALALAERTEGSESLPAAEAHRALSFPLVETGDYAAGRAHAERALAIAERACGPQDTRVAGFHRHLAYVLAHGAEFAAQKQQLERALEIDEQAYGPDHPEVGAALRQLARSSLQASGDLERAAACCERAVAIAGKAYGPRHSYVSWALYDLAGVRQLQGQSAAAQSLLERALAIFVDDFFCHRMGVVLADLGDLEGARASLERAVAVVKEWSGEDDHPFQHNVLPDLARVLRLQGKLEEARACLDRFRAKSQLSPLRYWARMPAMHLEYGLTLQALGDLAGARERLTQAVALSERRLGPRHPHTDKARRALAALDAERA